MDTANVAPFEVIAGPAEAWYAPVGTAFPELDVAPGGSWTKIGAAGDRSYLEEGVKVMAPQELTYFKGLGSTGDRKAFRVSEEFKVGFSVADMTVEQWKISMNGNAITNTTGSPRKIGLSRGLQVEQYALLLRGPSPYGDGWVTQFEIPVCVESGNPEVVYKKDAAAALAVEFKALEDPLAASNDESFGRLMVQDASSDT